MKNNFYPPIVESFIPAFVVGGNLRIYFAMPPFLNSSKIISVQAIVNFQSNNNSALDQSKNKSPGGVYNCKQYNIDENIETDYKNYIEIPNTAIKDGFKANQLYKIQLRFFTGENKSILEINELRNMILTSVNLYKYRDYFSEWSKIILVKPINQPSLILNGITDNEINTSKDISTTRYNSNTIYEVSGRLVFENEEENIIAREYLSDYRIKITNTYNGDILLDSGKIYTEEYDPNSFNYILPKEMEVGQSYSIEVTYTTNSGYQDTITLPIYINGGYLESLKMNIDSEPNYDNGSIKVHITSQDNEGYMGNLTIRRASQKSNFEIWEDITTVQVRQSTLLDYYWEDFSIESGVWYKYAVQIRSAKKKMRGKMYKQSYATMTEFEDVYLINTAGILRLKYDVNIDSIKHNIIESKTDTIGSKFPYINRNGSVDYRTFSLNGLITGYMDMDNLFFNPNTEFENISEEYFRYNIGNNGSIFDYNNETSRYFPINLDNNFIYEKAFRDKVVTFLKANNAKLFKSSPEGNILVKLIDINLSPNKSLGRRIYSFSATVVEIDECNIDNYEKYNIINKGKVESNISNKYYKLVQINKQGENFSNVSDLLSNKTRENQKYGYINKLLKIEWLRFNIDTQKTPPMIIELNNDGTINWELTQNHISLEENSENINSHNNYIYLYYTKDGKQVSKKIFLDSKDPEDIKLLNQYFITEVNYHANKYLRRANQVLNERVPITKEQSFKPTNIRIQEDEIQAGSYTPQTYYANNSQEYSSSSGSEKVNKQVIIGYPIQINGEDIIIGTNGIYEVDGTNTNLGLQIIQSFDNDNSFTQDYDWTIDAYVQYEEQFDESQYADSYINSIHTEQLYQTFLPNEPIVDEIYGRKKLEIKSNDLRLERINKLTAIDKLDIEAQPGTIVYVKDSFDTSQYYKYEINMNGRLSLYNENTTIDNFYFYGLHLHPLPTSHLLGNLRKEIEPTEYQESGTIDNLNITNIPNNSVFNIILNFDNPSTKEIETYNILLKSLVYEKVRLDTRNESIFNDMLIQELKENEGRVIYHNNKWYVFTKDDIVFKPVEAVVNYVYEMTEERYNG